jgi:hypothetical protein
MDYSSSAVALVLRAILPAELADSITTHVLHPDSPVQVLKRRAYLEADRAFRAAYPLVQPLVDRTLAYAARSEGLVSALVAASAVAFAFIVLVWIQRLAVWFTRMAMRLTFWALFALLAAAVWQRGVLESARDAAVVAGKIAGYMAVIKDIWLEEYNRYEAQQQMSSAAARATRARR